MDEQALPEDNIFDFGRRDPDNVIGQTNALNLMQRVLHHFEQKTTGQAPATTAPYFLDVRNFTDEQQFALEKAKLFRQTPLMMGLSSEVPHPGDFLTNSYLDIPVLITRNKDGELKAFLNVCRHRGARLKSDATGHCSVFACPFHGWIYDLDGRLERVFTESKFGTIDRAAHGLIALPCAEKYGMIFVRPTPGDSVDIDDILGNLAPELKGWRLERMSPFARKEFTLPTNWKLAMDTYFEAYHVPALHPKTLAPMCIPETTVHDRYGAAGQHVRVTHAIPGITELRKMPESQWNILTSVGMIYYIFPNVCLTLGSFGLNYFELYPGNTPGQQITSFRHFAPGALNSDADRARTQEWFDFIYNVISTEDYAAAANIYRGLASGVHPYSILGRNELALIWIHETIRAAIGMGPPKVQPDITTSPIAAE